MIAECTIEGQSIDQAIAWAASELEGFSRSECVRSDLKTHPCLSGLLCDSARLLALPKSGETIVMAGLDQAALIPLRGIAPRRAARESMKEKIRCRGYISRNLKKARSLITR